MPSWTNDSERWNEGELWLWQPSLFTPLRAVRRLNTTKSDSQSDKSLLCCRLGVLSPALFQTSRGQRIKRERLGTRLSKNNFRSEEVFQRPQNLSIDFVPDLTPYLGFSIKRFVTCEPDSERISYIYPKQPRWKLIHGSLHAGNCPLFWLLPHYCYGSLVIP